MPKINLEMNSRMVLGIVGLIVVAVFILGNVNIEVWALWLAVISGFALALILLSEAGALQYFQQSKFKSFGFGDVVVFLSILVGAAVLIQAITLIGVIGKVVPEALSGYLNTQGLVIGILAAILLVYHMFTKRPE